PPGPLAPLEQTTRHGLGLVEPGDGAGPLLCVAGRQGVPGDVAGPQRASRTPAVARILLRSHRHTRASAPCARCGALLWAPARLGGGPVGGPWPWPSMPRPWGRA